MRNTTMLKAVLLKYSITIDMDDDEKFTMQLKDKQSNKVEVIKSKNYSGLIRKAYSYLLQDLKGSE
ncbi:MAG: hypothetical protein IPG60_15290 [Bacteroidetes bacterium]|nr:hypothetical protein [Bacteroidota bacterium]